MWCQPVSIATSLLPGESFEVFYRKFPDLTWVPFLPNPVVPNFDICGLQPGNYEIKIRKIQANGNPCKESTQSFSIGSLICIPILPITYDLPNAVIGEPYSVSIPFGGTLPATVTPVNVPSWMTVSIVGTNIVLSGMPTGVSLTDVPVEFSVDNCGEAPVNFSDTINVNAPVSGFTPILQMAPNEANPVCYDDVWIDFNVGNSSFTYEITLVDYMNTDQQSYDSPYPPVNLPPTGTVVTKYGAGSLSATRLRATTGGGGGIGFSGFDITIVEYYLGNPTGNSWASVFLGTLNNRTPC